MRERSKGTRALACATRPSSQARKSAHFSFPLLLIHKKKNSRDFGLDLAEPAEFLSCNGPEYLARLGPLPCRAEPSSGRARKSSGRALNSARMSSLSDVLRPEARKEGITTLSGAKSSLLTVRDDAHLRLFSYFSITSESCLTGPSTPCIGSLRHLHDEADTLSDPS
jgi:hypothetical protein